jgi:hypothetical protein
MSLTTGMANDLVTATLSRFGATDATQPHVSLQQYGTSTLGYRSPAELEAMQEIA